MILPIFEWVDVILVLLYDCVQSCGVEPVDAFWLSEGKSQSYDSVQARHPYFEIPFLDVLDVGR